MLSEFHTSEKRAVFRACVTFLNFRYSRISLNRRFSVENSQLTPTLQKPEVKQHGKIDPILRVHQWGYPKISGFAMILVIITNH